MLAPVLSVLPLVYHGELLMKVYQIQLGAGLDGLSLDERSEPMPAPGQVLIKVKAVSLNDRDLLILKGVGQQGFITPRYFQLPY